VTRVSCLVEVNGIGLGGEETTTWKVSRLWGGRADGHASGQPVRKEKASQPTQTHRHVATSAVLSENI